MITKILIVDDHPIVRRGLKEIVEEDKNLKVVAEVSSAAETIPALRDCKADIVLLDISMPGQSGLDILQDIINEFPQTRILVLSAMLEDIYAKRVLKNGAHGFLNKDSAPEQLLFAIKQITAGKKYISMQLAEQFADDIAGNKNILSHEILSEREFEVLRHLGNGKSISEIAIYLNLSSTTISTYRSRILEKMGLKNNSELIKYCLDAKLLIN